MMKRKGIHNLRTLSFLKDAVCTLAEPNKDKMIRRIESWLNEATYKEHLAGLNWYAKANEFCEIISQELSIPLEGVANALSILSPQQSWETNKRNTVLVATVGEDADIFATKKQREEAWDAMFAGFRIPPTRFKTFSFADNISNPESVEVTVDRHAASVALNDLSPISTKITDKRYIEIADAYRAVAKKKNMMPYQLQAITWVVYKRVVNR